MLIAEIDKASHWHVETFIWITGLLCDWALSMPRLHSELCMKYCEKCAISYEIVIWGFTCSLTQLGCWRGYPGTVLQLENSVKVTVCEDLQDKNLQVLVNVVVINTWIFRWKNFPHWNGERLRKENWESLWAEIKIVEQESKSCSCKQSHARNLSTACHRQADVHLYQGKSSNQGSTTHCAYLARQEPSL